MTHNHFYRGLFVAFGALVLLTSAASAGPNNRLKGTYANAGGGAFYCVFTDDGGIVPKPVPDDGFDVSIATQSQSIQFFDTIFDFDGRGNLTYLNPPGIFGINSQPLETSVSNFTIPVVGLGTYVVNPTGGTDALSRSTFEFEYSVFLDFGGGGLFPLTSALEGRGYISLSGEAISWGVSSVQMRDRFFDGQDQICGWSINAVRVGNG